MGSSSLRFRGLAARYATARSLLRVGCGVSADRLYGCERFMLQHSRPVAACPQESRPSKCSGNLFGHAVPSMLPPLWQRGDGGISSAATPGLSPLAPLINGRNGGEIMANKVPCFRTRGTQWAEKQWMRGQCCGRSTLISVAQRHWRGASALYAYGIRPGPQETPGSPAVQRYRTPR
jgi:hypothetical protein